MRVSALSFWCSFAEAKKHGTFPRKGSKAVHIQRPQACLWLAVADFAPRCRLQPELEGRAQPWAGARSTNRATGSAKVSAKDSTFSLPNH